MHSSPTAQAPNNHSAQTDLSSSGHLQERDLEAQKHPQLVSKPSLSATFEAAALLTIWSILVINEGAIRVIDQNPSVDLLSAGRPSKFFPFLGGLFEVAFGLLGLFIGLAAFLSDKHSSASTKISMAMQTALGYYVFVVFVFVIPVYRAIDTVQPALEGLSVAQTRFIITMGIFTSFHFCLALQGGQFVFMARLVCATTGQNFLRQQTGNRMRAVFWNANLALSGLWTLITGAIVINNVGSGRLEMPFFSPPNVGVLPGFTVFTGLVMVACGVSGAIVAIRNSAPLWYMYTCAAVFTVALLNYGVLQFALFADAPSGPVALHNGLVFMVVFMGAYFVRLNARDHVESSVL